LQRAYACGSSPELAATDFSCEGRWSESSTDGVNLALDDHRQLCAALAGPVNGFKPRSRAILAVLKPALTAQRSALTGCQLRSPSLVRGGHRPRRVHRPMEPLANSKLSEARPLGDDTTAFSARIPPFENRVSGARVHALPSSAAQTLPASVHGTARLFRHANSCGMSAP
jgi:hypothetical protein